MGRVLVIIGCAVLIAACGQETKTQNSDDLAPPGSESAVFVNYADDFVEFWDATTDLPIKQRVEVFKNDVASKFPGFYGIERYEGRLTQGGLDKRIAAQIEGFAEIREGFIAKVDRFNAELDQNLATFKSAFPEFEIPVDVVLLHSFGQFDGATRTLAEKKYLLFGADLMTRVHSWEDESAFFHHELFHTLHDQSFTECDEIWCALWAEGLATYAASALNPDAGEPELLLDFPPGLAVDTREQLGPSFQHLKTVLNSTDEKIYSGLFNTRLDDTGLPPRRGYYLGFLIAQEIAATRELSVLAAMGNEEAEPLIKDAIDALLAKHTTQ